MKLCRRRMVYACAVFAGFLVVSIGCVTNKDIDSYEARLKTLENKGTPDSILSTARVCIEQARAGKKAGNGVVVRANIDSLKVTIGNAEKWCGAAMQVNKDRVDSIVKACTAGESGLTGLQAKTADSMLGVINAFTAKGWYVQARPLADQLDSLMPSLLKDEQNAQKIGPLLVGTWTQTKHITDNGANAVQKTKVSFKKDGTFAMNEEMKGQTTLQLKEDWQFLSEGNFGLKGDTILLMTMKEKRVREIFWNLVDKGGKTEWVKRERPPYDSLIKEGKKVRPIVYDDLKQNFKK